MLYYAAPSGARWVIPLPVIALGISLVGWAGWVHRYIGRWKSLNLGLLHTTFCIHLSSEGKIKFQTFLYSGCGSRVSDRTRLSCLYLVAEALISALSHALRDALQAKEGSTGSTSRHHAMLFNPGGVSWGSSPSSIPLPPKRDLPIPTVVILSFCHPVLRIIPHCVGLSSE